MGRHTTGDANNLHFHFWLAFSSGGNVRMTRTEPDCARDEHKMRMVASLPKALWRTPVLSGSIQVHAPDSLPVSIDVEAASETLRQTLGVDIDLKIIPPATPESPR